MDAFSLDFSRAFDCLDHDLLVRKLKLRVGQELSTPYEATYGVPQGSHLGPILFLLYMQDLVARLLVNHSLYADDLMINQKISGYADALVLQAKLNVVARWGTLNSLHLNPTKCQVITFSRRLGNTVDTSYTLGTSQLARVSEVKDLGVVGRCFKLWTDLTNGT